VDVEIASATPLPPTPLSPEAQDRASFLASIISAYVGAKFESPEAGLIVGLVVYLIAKKTVSRFDPYSRSPTASRASWWVAYSWISTSRPSGAKRKAAP
jgi:hypothetical protein